MAEVGGDGDQSEAKSRQGSYDRGIANSRARSSGYLRSSRLSLLS